MKDVSGTWRFSQELAAEDKEQIPASLAEFSLLLKTDGTFVAENAPDDLFFTGSVSPVLRKCTGRWRVSQEEGYTLFLEFSAGLWSRGIEVRKMKTVIRIDREIGHGIATFYLIRST